MNTVVEHRQETHGGDSRVHVMNTQIEPRLTTSRMWVRFVDHYAAAVAAVLEVVTILAIVAFRQAGFVDIAAFGGLLLIVAVLTMKTRLESRWDSESERARETVGRPHVSGAR